MKKIFCTFLVLLLTISLALPTAGVVFAATPTVLFSDDFESGLDTTNKWNWVSGKTGSTWNTVDYDGLKVVFTFCACKFNSR